MNSRAIHGVGRRRCLWLAAALLLPAIVSGAEIQASTDAELHAALRSAKPGDHIRLGAGPYGGGFYQIGLQGTAEQPIRVSGPSSNNPAVFGSSGKGILHLVQAAHVELENLHIRQAGSNGLAFDDGGKLDFSCHHISLRDIRIEEVGPKGNIDGIKLAGVSDFTISHVVFQKWGDGGAAIDGVGCRRGEVSGCQFLPGRGSVGIQFKGGSEQIVIRENLFDDCASRGVNVGGSTGMAYFRPKPQGFEARNIVVEGNVFIGCDAPVAFPNTDGADVRFNTIYLPRRWAFRILQETNREDFTPSRNGRIENNIIVFKSTQWFAGGINIGPNTAAETFRFAGNLWYCVDNPGRSGPKLPSAERDGLIGIDPQFVDVDKRDFSLRPRSPAKGKGHTAVPAATQPR